MRKARFIFFALPEATVRTNKATHTRLNARLLLLVNFKFGRSSANVQRLVNLGFAFT